MANFNKMICKRFRVTIASRRSHRVVMTGDDNSGQLRPLSMLALTCGDTLYVSDSLSGYSFRSALGATSRHGSLDSSAPQRVKGQLLEQCSTVYRPFDRLMGLCRA
jgi:hypothetical protein